jgi:N-acetylated-alpha-linked acidic dipeptidase
MVADPGSEAQEMAVDFGPVLAAVHTFGAAGEALDGAVDALIARQAPAAASALNDPLMLLERSFLSKDGLPERPWFRHLLYAPGLTTGYAAWPFPELAEAVEKRDPELFSSGVTRVVGVLERATKDLETASRLATVQSD